MKEDSGTHAGSAAAGALMAWLVGERAPHAALFYFMHTLRVWPFRWTLPLLGHDRLQLHVCPCVLTSSASPTSPGWPDVPLLHRGHLCRHVHLLPGRDQATGAHPLRKRAHLP